MPDGGSLAAMRTEPVLGNGRVFVATSKKATFTCWNREGEAVEAHKYKSGLSRYCHVFGQCDGPTPLADAGIRGQHDMVKEWLDTISTCELEPFPNHGLS